MPSSQTLNAKALAVGAFVAVGWRVLHKLRRHQLKGTQDSRHGTQELLARSKTFSRSRCHLTESFWKDAFVQLKEKEAREQHQVDKYGFKVVSDLQFNSLLLCVVSVHSTTSSQLGAPMMMVCVHMFNTGLLWQWNALAAVSSLSVQLTAVSLGSMDAVAVAHGVLPPSLERYMEAYLEAPPTPQVEVAGAVAQSITASNSGTMQVLSPASRWSTVFLRSLSSHLCLLELPSTPVDISDLYMRVPSWVMTKGLPDGSCSLQIPCHAHAKGPFCAGQPCLAPPAPAPVSSANVAAGKAELDITEMVKYNAEGSRYVAAAAVTASDEPATEGHMSAAAAGMCREEQASADLEDLGFTCIIEDSNAAVNSHPADAPLTDSDTSAAAHDSSAAVTAPAAFEGKVVGDIGCKASKYGLHRTTWTTPVPGPIWNTMLGLAPAPAPPLHPAPAAPPAPIPAPVLTAVQPAADWQAVASLVSRLQAAVQLTPGVTQPEDQVVGVEVCLTDFPAQAVVPCIPVDTVMCCLDLMGRGSYGQVYRARVLGEASFSMVIKLTDAADPNAANAEFSHLEGLEAAGVRHTVQPLGRYSSPVGQVILMTLAEGLTGTALRDELHGRDAWGVPRYTPEEVEWVVIRVACSLLRGLGHMHSKDLTPSDIKPANLIVDPAMMCGGQGPVCKYIDLGMMVQANAVGWGGTRTYCDPEWLRCDQAGLQPPVQGVCDVHSVGMVLWELLAGKVPLEATVAVAALNGQDVLLVHHLAMQQVACWVSGGPEGMGAADLSADVGRYSLAMQSFLLSLICKPHMRRTPAQALGDPLFFGLPADL